MKVLRVTMPDGSKWDVPAEEIAKHRASYYAVRDGNSDTFKREFDFAMSDNYELTDWAENNMNWEDVEAIATRWIAPVPGDVDYREGWVGGHKEVITL